MMSHHESAENNRLMKLFEEQKAGKLPRQFPDGRLGAKDDGALLLKVGGDQERQVVMIEFAEPTRWLAMPPQDAINFAQMLIKQARAISCVPVKVVL